MKTGKQPKAKRSPLRNLRLPREEELEIKEEMAASGRSRTALIVEALRIRRGALEAIGVEIETTMPTALPRLIASHCSAGAQVLGRMKKTTSPSSRIKAR